MPWIRESTVRKPLRVLKAILFLGMLLAIGVEKAAAQQIQLASPFTDHMVLQRGKPLQIWGSAPAGSVIQVRLADQQQQATTTTDGRWNVQLQPLKAGGPFDLTVSAGQNNATVHDVLIGDVWLCSGQSNMQFSLGECDDGAAVAAVPHPLLRLGKVGTAWTKTPQFSAKISWLAADPDGAKHFSAIAYAFAHELEKDPALKDVPIGIWQDCLGATVIESWLPQSALKEFDPKELQSSMFGIGPTLLFNGMIAPLGRSAFAGVIWYQGEGNSGEPNRYARLLPLLFSSWREQFSDPALPMLVVQLPDYAPDWGGIYWQWMRESQAIAVDETPNTGLAVSIGTNDGWLLHPQGKHEISRRLALLARQMVYREKIAGKSPVFKSMKIDGARAVVQFDVDGDSLANPAGAVRGFELAGIDGIYHAASAEMSNDTVVVSSPAVPKPASVRYAWAGVPDATLTNGSGIPAAPFRTDHQQFVRGTGEAQHQPGGYDFKSKEYQVNVSSNGVVTSLVVKNQQLLSNAATPWGGARIRGRELNPVTLDNPQHLVGGNNETAVEINFTETGLQWKITNHHKKEAAVFDIALADSVMVKEGNNAEQLASRKGATVHFSGVDEVTSNTDVAADAGKVLRTTIPAGETKTIELQLGGH